MTIDSNARVEDSISPRAEAVERTSMRLPQLAHDLRQPLVVAAGYVSMLESATFGELSAEAAHALQIVSGRLEALCALIDTLDADGEPGQES